MKTVFDWLTMPVFRERTAMFLGRRNMEALDIWISGYPKPRNTLYPLGGEHT